jgi:acyl carrier protein
MMEINEFIKRFANQFDETDENEFLPETRFRDLEEWSSLIGMGIMNDIWKKYGVKITMMDFMSVSTIAELFELVKSKLS